MFFDCGPPCWAIISLMRKLSLGEIKKLSQCHSTKWQSRVWKLHSLSLPLSLHPSLPPSFLWPSSPLNLLLSENWLMKAWLPGPSPHLPHLSLTLLAYPVSWKTVWKHSLLLAHWVPRPIQSQMQCDLKALGCPS